MQTLTYIARHRPSVARLLQSVVLALVVTILFTETILAQTLTMSATDAPGISVTLNGTDQSASDPFTISVSDTRLLPTGWTLQITSTQFSTGSAILPTSTASITAVSATCTGLLCVPPSNSVSYPVIVPAGTSAPSPVAFFRAANQTGTGTTTVMPTFRVSIPANAYSGTYSSTITLTIVSGP